MECIKILEENLGGSFYNSDVKNFLITSSEWETMKDKFEHVRIQNICEAKPTVTNIKREKKLIKHVAQPLWQDIEKNKTLRLLWYKVQFPETLPEDTLGQELLGAKDTAKQGDEFPALTELTIQRWVRQIGKNRLSCHAEMSSVIKMKLRAAWEISGGWWGAGGQGRSLWGGDHSLRSKGQQGARENWGKGFPSGEAASARHGMTEEEPGLCEGVRESLWPRCPSWGQRGAPWE